METNMAAICKDCSVDTTPCTGKRGCRHKDRWEYYMVHNELWQAAKMQAGFLCIGCLERRIDRQLRPHDFTDSRINDSEHPWDTDRLHSRKDKGREQMPRRLKNGVDLNAVATMREDIARVIDPNAMKLFEMDNQPDANPNAKIPARIRKALEKSDAVMTVIRDSLASSKRAQARELKMRVNQIDERKKP
jgi:hypothetical protein